MSRRFERAGRAKSGPGAERPGAGLSCRLAEQVLDSDPVLACLLAEVDA